MAVMTSAARFLCVLLGAAWLGCSSPSPSGGSPTSDGGPAKIGDADERCMSGAYAGTEECDKCESGACCNQYFACYDDSDCFKADWNFDVCVASIGSDAGTDAWGDAAVPKTAADCWSAFVAQGKQAAQTYYDCVHANCSKCESSP